MSVKPSGPLSLSDIAAEFGGGKPYSLSQFYRNGGRVPDSPQNQKIPTSGKVSIGDFYGAASQYEATLDSNVENFNLRSWFDSIFGDPGSKPVRFVVKINSVTIGGTGSSYALDVGQFPSGSYIEVNNYGSIQGHGGHPNSGDGGHAIRANYGGQTVIINNHNQILAGGGAGGGGGTGGSGGPGYYNSTAHATPNCCYSGFNCNYCPSGYRCHGDRYCGFGGSSCQSCTKTVRHNTSGGAGGAGGSGGWGQGYDHDRTNGATGGGGSNGGRNAGRGGTGGTGGNGGSWGQNGGDGNQGSTGSGGNRGGGSGGSSGTGGGVAGAYLVKGDAATTLHNYKTVAGRVI